MIENCRNSHKNSEIVKHHLSRFFLSTLWTRPLNYGWLADWQHFTPQCERMFTHPSLNILYHYSSFIHYSFAMKHTNSRLIFTSLVYSAWRKWITAEILHLVDVNCRTHRNLLCRDKSKHRMASYMTIYKAVNESWCYLMFVSRRNVHLSYYTTNTFLWMVI